MANELLDRIKGQSDNLKKKIAARNVEYIEPSTIQERITGKVNRSPVEEIPLMMEGVEESNFGQEIPAVQEEQFVTDLIDTAIPQYTQEQEIPMAPPVDPTQVQVGIPQGQQVGQLQGQNAPYNPLDVGNIARGLQTGYSQRGMAIGDEAIESAIQNEKAAKLQSEYAIKEKQLFDEVTNGMQKRQEQRKIEGEELKKVLRAPMDLDPNQWWNSRTTGQKIMGYGAALLSGFGGQAINIMQSAIRDDIAAQKENYKTNRENAKGIYALGKDLGLGDAEIEKLGLFSGRRKLNETLKAEIMKTKSPLVKARGAKGIAENSIAMQKDFLSLAAAISKGKKEDKPEKLANEAVNKLELVSTFIGSTNRMINALKKGQWRKGIGSSQFKRAAREAGLDLGFYKSGANVADREAAVIDKILSGDLIMDWREVAKTLQRMNSSMSNFAYARMEAQNIDPATIDKLSSRYGFRDPQRKQRTPKKFDIVR